MLKWAGVLFDFQSSVNNSSDRKKKEELPKQIVKITPHAGGLEAKDFCNITLRMLEKFLINNQIKYKISEKTDYLIQLEVVAPIGFLDFFTGVLKLVRVSPFGKGDKLHTSFCKITTQVIGEKKQIVILEKDLKWDYFKSPGPGGQKKNKTMSAVRLVHIPTSITVISCNERSQNDNKRKALEQLQIELEKRQFNDVSEAKKKSWENAIKPEDANISFYFNHQMACNEKTSIKTTRLKEVLNGQLDYLKN
jgi:protein subunit release factor B